MNFRHRMAAVLRPIRTFLVTVTCALVLFMNAAPALAISSPPTDPAKGEPGLQDIFEKSEDALKSDDTLTMKVKDEANKGINEVQGAADKNDMYRPENSQQATDAETQVERALSKITEKFPGNNR
ncbi:hypothetical protein NDI45_18120 [Leptolyngbya sp. GB1-A1]|uniref:hypothetical protein n=1 Tax=Leptolyngbya sp. GB1-A1 TaxID=2933908 RepID=UPI003297F101